MDGSIWINQNTSFYLISNQDTCQPWKEMTKNWRKVENLDILFVFNIEITLSITAYKHQHNWLEHILMDQTIRFQRSTIEVDWPFRHGTLAVIHCHLTNKKVNKHLKSKERGWKTKRLRNSPKLPRIVCHFGLSPWPRVFEIQDFKIVH